MTKSNKEKLKKIGMQEEFASWKESVKNRKRGFEVGSLVRIKKGVFCYNYSTPGSEGVIVTIRPHSFDVEFNHLTTRLKCPQGRHPVFTIDKENVELI